MSAPVHAVYDTTILASGIVATRDPIAHIINAAISGQVELIISPYILDELRRTLTTKRYFRDRITDAERETYLSRLEAVATLITPHHALSGVVADPNDDPIIDLAVSAQARYLVTGDKKVLDVGEYQGVKILTARDFFALLSQRTTS
jgi:putative PIN family toxin of toxin-antitoxin system